MKEEDFTVSATAKVETRETAEAAVQRVAREHTQRREAKAQSARAKHTAEAYLATFVNAWAETHTGIPMAAWSLADKGMVKKVLASRFRSIDERHAFLDFAVRHWSAILKHELGWMRQSQPPALPSLRFMLSNKMASYFFDAFAERGKYERDTRLPADERDLQRLLDTGMSRDEALIALGERRALSRQREEDDRKRIDHRAVMLRAQAERRKLEEAQKDIMRQRYEMLQEQKRAKENRERPAPEPFPELDDITFEPLPPFDPNQFN